MLLRIGINDSLVPRRNSGSSSRTAFAPRISKDLVVPVLSEVEQRTSLFQATQLETQVTAHPTSNYQLNQNVAEFVFRWKEWITPPDANKQNGGTPVLTPDGRPIQDFAYPTLGIIGRGYHVRNWANDRDDVQEVIKYAREEPYFFEFLDFLFIKFGLENSGMGKAGHQIVYRFLLASPREICEAAIEAVKLYEKFADPVTR
jgi:hypothetical protein